MVCGRVNCRLAWFEDFMCSHLGKIVSTVTYSEFFSQNEWLDKIEECKTNFKLKLEQEVTEGDKEELSEDTKSSSGTSTNPFEAGSNPFLDNNPFANENDNDTSDEMNPFKEKKSTNPFDDEDEGWQEKL